MICGTSTLRLHLQSADAGDVFEHGTHSGGVGAELIEFRAKDAHDDAGTGSGEHFLDAPAQEGEQVAGEAGYPSTTACTL